MPRVLPVDAECEGRSILAARDPCLDDVADELRLIDRLAEFVLLEIACDSADAR
jgi:hypothetical protein